MVRARSRSAAVPSPSVTGRCPLIELQPAMRRRGRECGAHDPAEICDPRGSSRRGPASGARDSVKTSTCEASGRLLPGRPCFCRAWRAFHGGWGHLANPWTSPKEPACKRFTAAPADDRDVGGGAAVSIGTVVARRRRQRPGGGGDRARVRRRWRRRLPAQRRPPAPCAPAAPATIGFLIPDMANQVFSRVAIGPRRCCPPPATCCSPSPPTARRPARSPSSEAAQQRQMDG